MSSTYPKDAGNPKNNDVDYVIQFSFGDINSDQAISKLELLLRRLSEVGLQTELREGDEFSLLVFVRLSSKRRLKHAVYQSRIRDWLYGVSNTEPESESSAEPKSESERLRVIYHMITVPREAGGAGISPKHGEWENVLSVFPLHDVETNRRCMRDWSRKTFLSPEDLDQIRNTFGESVGFYFAFLQSYFKFLLFPAVFGFSCWLLLGSYSIIYTVINSLWCIIFIEYWKRQEEELSCQWQTKGVSAVRAKRKQFLPENEVRDESTGEIRGQVFIPTILLSALIPTMSTVLISVATKLNDYENYETQPAYDVALTQKIFVINFITSYLPIFLTAFVYVPFASRIVPYLDIFQMTVRPFVSRENAAALRTEFSIDPDRLRKQVIYFTVTAQVVNFAQEAILPIVKQRLLREYKEYMKKRSAKPDTDSDSEAKKTPAASVDDAPEEAEFLKRVRNETELEEYNVTEDLREMCIQFGYLALFSPIWPLVPVSFLINNWVELRSDFFKICVECKRPWPQRADTIGPWLESLGFLSWVGSITSAALLYMFSTGHEGPNGEPTTIQGWALLLTIFFSEHLYLIVRYAVRAAMSKLEPPNVRRERSERYMLRKRYLDSTISTRISDDEEDDDVTCADQSPKVSQISRETLEDDVREWSRRGTDKERFWMRQKGWRESAQVGSCIIQAMSNIKEDTKKQQ
ncbi:hypothetical protein EYZ11_001344 [Aspergillus tanneri]|uniref:Uncharacterized protein n=1 Tax=Aspergillus tanneri TaxID=1220188 RepID=A0A4S3JUT2_9EURO|nr:hypothetical protein EYZ11_001344 [Aspergillus tanneri]